jgi:hypothetical protein
MKIFLRSDPIKLISMCKVDVFHGSWQEFNTTTTTNYHVDTCMPPTANLVFDETLDIMMDISIKKMNAKQTLCTAHCVNERSM